MFDRLAFHAREHLSAPHAFAQVLADLKRFSRNIHLTPEAQSYTAERFAPVDFGQRYEFFAVLGGDGSVLSVVKRLQDFATPILPLSAGTLGFLAEIPPAELADALFSIEKGRFTYDRRSLLQVRRVRADGHSDDYFALNEAVISQQAVARMVEINTLVDGEYLTTHRADGLIVATPTGSTAYSMAAGGPIVYPRLDALILTPISPHSFSHRPLILPGGKIVTVLADDKNRVPLMLTIDGQTAVPLAADDRVEVSIAVPKLSFLRLPEEHFFKTIKRKLHWGKNAG